MVIYVENPKESTRKHLEIINEFRSVTGYKLYTENIFLYTNKHMETRMKNIITQ